MSAASVPSGVLLTFHKIVIIGLGKTGDSGDGVPKSRTATTCGNSVIMESKRTMEFPERSLVDF